MDHERVNIASSPMSCGVMELSRINEDTDGVLYALGSRLYHPSRGNPCAFFAFSDLYFRDEAVGPAYHLVQKVRELGLGEVMITTSAENPRTGNIIVVCIWEIDHARFKEYYAKVRVNKLAKVGS